MDSRKKVARIAGWLYLVAALPAPFALLYIPGKLIVRGDAAATARNILASESLFRLGIAGELLNAAFFLLVPFALYQLLKEVSKSQASLMVTLFAVSVPMSFLNTLNSMAALTLLRGADFLSVFNQAQRESLAMLFLRLHSQGFIGLQVFWGLWLLPLGLLVYRSGFLPRIVGVLLMINCFAYVADSVVLLLWPSYAHSVSQITLAPKFGEFVMIFWLIIAGAKERELQSAAPERA
jgi:uncharacterized protein DUF4386